MSGQKINMRGSWAGGSSKESPLPMGCKMKQFSSADGVGGLGMYADTTEAIKSQQMMNKSKVNGHPQKSGYRN